MPAATDGGLWLRDAGVARWRYNLDSSTRNLEVEAYDAAGALVDTPLIIETTATGNVDVTRANLRLGGTSLAAEVLFTPRSASGYGAGFSLGSTNQRWIIRKNATAESTGNAGADLEILARADNGSAIDTPLTLTRKAGGFAYWSRPNRIPSLSLASTSVVTAAGTTTLTATSNSVYIFTGTTTQSFTLSACNANGSSVSQQVWVKNLSTGTVTINRAGSDTIDGATSYSLTSGKAVHLASNGVSSWVVLGVA